MNLPLVSCLCVTRPNRFGLLQRSVLSFQAQHYEEREMVIVTSDEGYATAIRSWLHQIETGQKVAVTVVHRKVRTPAELIVHAMAKACGTYLAVWDDDNTDHPLRLFEQMTRQLRFPHNFTTLAESLYHFHDTKELYATSYQHATSVPVESHSALSTLIGQRCLWPEIEIHWQPHPVTSLVRAIVAKGVPLTTLQLPAFLHCVGVRGDNARGYDTHRKLAVDSPLGKDRAWLLAHREDFSAHLDAYPFDADRVIVHGRDAIAFEYEVKQHWPDGLFPVGEPDDDVKRITEPA